MFTGIVTEVGVVRAIAATAAERRFEIEAGLAGQLGIGSSVAVNGACLTAVEVAEDRFAVTAVAETLRRSNLGALDVGDGVDLELPLAADGRFDGHIVQGHVDAAGTVTGLSAEGESVRMEVAVPPAVAAQVVEKGSVTVDGVSLTVTAVSESAFEFVLIPHTLAVTVLGTRGLGDVVNVEIDVLAKYVARLLEKLP